MQVPDGDSVVGSSSKPLMLRVELQIIDLRFSIEIGQRFLEVLNVPDFDGADFSTSGDIFANWCNSQCGDGFVVSSEDVL